MALDAILKYRQHSMINEQNKQKFQINNAYLETTTTKGIIKMPIPTEETV